jgi:tetratricopeptide (TPR) repeat protein
LLLHSISDKSIDDAISFGRKQLSLCPRGHPNRISLLDGLSRVLFSKFEETGEAALLREVVSLRRHQLELCPPVHPKHARLLNNLALALRAQYEQDGDTSKLAELVNLHRKGLSLHPQDHPGRAMSLSNLAGALMAQWEQDGNETQLTQAVDLFRETLLMRPPGHPDRATLLNDLANALMTQYKQDGDTSKLAETVSRHREALSLRPEGHPNRCDSLSNLSNTYHAQFVRDGSESALIDALKLQRECLDSRIPGHPDRYAAHHSIARVHLVDSSLFDWEEALDHLMQAMTDNSAPPRKRLIQGIQSLRRVETASARDPEHYLYSQQALNVYLQAIQLLPRADHAGLDVSARLRALSGSEQICRAAAMRAMLLGQLPTAVEVFEEGKAAIWSQALGLRSTAMDILPTADSDRLRDLFRMLDADHTGSSVVGLEKVDLDHTIEHRHQLNDQAGRLIDEIRRRPGFDRFLRIPQFEQLAQAASNSYVIALVANEPIFFAIVIQVGQGPQLVPLPSVNGDKLRRLIKPTSGSGMCDAVERAVMKKKVRPCVPLEQMWRTIIEPVLLHLGLQVRHDRLFQSLPSHVSNRKPRDDNGHVCTGTLRGTLHCCRCMPLEFTRVISKPAFQIT